MADTKETPESQTPQDHEIKFKDHFAETVPSRLKTPSTCVADFCLIPIGTRTASVSNEVADVQRLMQTCGLTYSMHSAGTTVEGSWDEVMHVIGQAHTLLHEKEIVRIQTDIRVGSRTDKTQHFEEKVTAVDKLLAMDKKPKSTDES